MLSEFTVIRPGRLSQHLLSSSYSPRMYARRIMQILYWSEESSICIYSTRQKNSLQAFGYISAESEHEIWNNVSQMMGAGSSRLWARSAQ